MYTLKYNATVFQFIVIAFSNHNVSFKFTRCSSLAKSLFWIYIFFLSACSTTGTPLTKYNNIDAQHQAMTCPGVPETQTTTRQQQQRQANQLANQGFRLLEKQNFQLAFICYETSSKLYETINDIVSLITSYSRLGDISHRLGNTPLAINYFERALSFQQSHGRTGGRIRNLNNIANLYSITGQYDTALKRLERAQSLIDDQNINDPDLSVDTKTNLGAIHLNLRQYKTAILYLNAARNEADDNERKARALKFLGAVYRQQGDFEKAMDYYQQALTIDILSGLQQEIATTEQVLGELYLHRIKGSKEVNQQQALRYLNKAYNSFSDINNTLSSAIVSSHIGEYYHQLRQYDNAMSRYQQALKEFERRGYKDGIGRMHLHMGYTLQKKGDLHSSLDHFDSAITIYGALHDKEWGRIAFYGKALTLETSGHLGKAEQMYKHSINMLESIRHNIAGGEEAQEIFAQVNALVYENLVSLLVKKGDFDSAHEYVERSRLRTLREYILYEQQIDGVRGDNLLSKARDLSRQRSILKTIARSPTTNSDKPNEYIKQVLAKNNAEFNRVFHKLSREHGAMSKTINIVPHSRQFRKSENFPDKLAILTYFLTENSLFIFIAKKGKDVTVIEVAIPRRDLRVLTAKAVELISRKPTSNDRHEKTVLTRLYNILIKPIDLELVGIKTIGILPFDILSILPFEALQVPNQPTKSKFLIQHKDIFYFVNHNYTNTLLSIMSDLKSPPMVSFVAFGAPQRNDAKKLHHAKLEVENIKKYFPNTLALLGKQASKDNFFKHWGKFQGIHLATHAKLVKDSTEILLSPEKTGNLSMAEIMELEDPEQTRFVVLSACQTAVDPVIFNKILKAKPGKKLSNIEAIPLASAVDILLSKNITSVVAALWNVNDQSTAILMQHFYRNLSNDIPFHKAFKKAQRTMIESNRWYAEPYYWAGFVSFGMYQ